MNQPCQLPPDGWFCSLDANHDGPCPTRRNRKCLPCQLRLKWKSRTSPWWKNDPTPRTLGWLDNRCVRCGAALKESA